MKINNEKYLHVLRDFTITHDGILYSQFGRQISQRKNIYGYPQTNVWCPTVSRAYNVFIHTLVAIAHVPNPFNFSNVNHRDGDKLNNHKDNLEWVTPKQNKAHAVLNGLYRHRDLVVYNPKTGEFIGEYHSSYQCERAMRDKGIILKASNINACCRRKDYTLKGMMFFYKDEFSAEELAYRMANKGKPSKPYCPTRPEMAAKTIKSVRKRYAKGERICDISEKTGVSNRNVYLIVNNKTWKNA